MLQQQGGATMARVAVVVALFAFGLIAIAQTGAAQAPTDPQNTSAQITLPAGTAVELAVTAPIWARNAKAGDPLYMQVIFPAGVSDSIAIPAGTYVQGKLLSVTKPTRKNNRATIDVLFSKIIFANGYTVALSDAASDVNAPAATLNVQASPSNDLLLDNGAQVEMTLAAPLSFDTAQIAQALPLSRPIDPGKFQSATLCRPTPGTPGTPGTSDTIIPGTPGTPSTTIPGGPGMPDIVIPGTPSTPDTVIPGTPGTPGFAGTSCPAPPMVTASNPLILPPAPITPSSPAQPQ